MTANLTLIENNPNVWKRLIATLDQSKVGFDFVRTDDEEVVKVDGRNEGSRGYSAERAAHSGSFTRDQGKPVRSFEELSLIRRVLTVTVH